MALFCVFMDLNYVAIPFQPSFFATPVQFSITYMYTRVPAHTLYSKENFYFLTK